MVRKKILHITQATGGVKTYTADVLQHADPAAFQFSVIAPADDIFEEFCRKRAIIYYPINLERNLNPFNNLGILFRIISVIKKEKPDFIHCHSAKGGFLGRMAAKFTSTKIIYTPHAFSYLSFSGVKRMIFYGLEYMARKWTTTLLAISYSEANRAIYELGYDKSKIRVILNSLMIPEAIPVHEYSKCINIRMIGRLTLQKNPLLFLEIANELLIKYPNLQFSILGAGIHDDLTTEIKSYLQENNLMNNITIEHWGDPETSKRFLQEADVFVMTSVFEGLPFSLLEAMLMGVPCVVSRVDGNTDVIHNNENGFSCLSGEEFFKKIELLILSEDLRTKLGKAGQDYVKDKHDIKKRIKQLEILYREL